MSISRLPDPKIGDRFGKLVVLSLHTDHTATVRRVWVMQCDCGKQATVAYSELRHGRRVSCGCFRGKVALGGRRQYQPGISNHNPKTLFSIFRTGAEKRGLAMELTIEQWMFLRSLPCGYCGGKTTGVDRICSDLGYVKGNVTAACERCNKMKHSQSSDEWYEHMERILRHTQKRDPKRYLLEVES